MTLTTLGEIALNINTLLYGLLYLPQLWRNRNPKHFEQMSFGFHSILLLALTFDLYYAFGRIEQWQYQLVGVTMFAALLIQHRQWWHCVKHTALRKHYLILSTTVILLLMGLVVIPFQLATPQLYIVMGWLARLGYWSYSAPQILKNYRDQQSQAVSPVFLSCCLCIHILDATAAWTLHWGSPSLYGAPIGFGLHCTLLYQYFLYRRPLLVS